MLSRKAWKHDLLLVMSLRSRQLQLFLHIIGSTLSVRFSKNWFLLYTVYHTAFYVGYGAIPLYGYLSGLRLNVYGVEDIDGCNTT